ncbi:hypothetical protein QRD02_03325 [Aequorivita sp. SDUM287046]|uniref:Uncharacterized protein n=1 Tax=Aequorivita aurantiaca TaxID=3053356 RepID=A0ABT8DDS7_9FLAO|nr:hypothetical protein [Aequorivita aurantiaca]MDN3723401.1 hypothetical protein [Aequorivita aurantiaca]
MKTLKQKLRYYKGWTVSKSDMYGLQPSKRLNILYHRHHRPHCGTINLIVNTKKKPLTKSEGLLKEGGDLLSHEVQYHRRKRA